MKSIFWTIGLSAALLVIGPAAIGCGGDGSNGTSSGSTDAGPSNDEDDEDGGGVVSNDGEPDASENNTPDPQPECSGIELTSSGALDVDLEPVEINGEVTVDGETMPDADEGRGQLVLREVDDRAATAIPLDDSGAATFDVALEPGTYDVEFAANTSLCASDPSTEVPCTGGIVDEEVALTADGTYDVDIETVEVNGQVTVDGEQMPEGAADRGTLVFRNDDGSAASTEPLGAGGEASYRMRLIAGNYQVEWAPGDAHCGAEPAGDVPCSGGVVNEEASLGSSGSLDVDLETADVTGEVTVEGDDLPDVGGERGQLSFAGPTGKPAVTRPLGTSGRATYEVTLLAGTYDIAWQPPASLCADDPTPGVPCVAGTLRDSIDLSASGDLDVDVPLVEVNGNASLDGGEMPVGSDEAGALAFSLHGGGQLETRPFDVVGDPEYRVSLIPGTYDVAWSHPVSTCAADDDLEIPCMSGAIESEIELTADGSLDVDVPRVEVNGAVTIDDAQMPSASQTRGRLVFVREDGATLTEPMGEAGEARYDRVFLPGRYDVRWEPGELLCDSDSQPGVPCSGGSVTREVDLTSSGALDVDVPLVEVTGNVTLAGEEMPDATSDRGGITFQHIEDGQPADDALGASGAASYETSLLSRSYLVYFSGNAARCSESSPIPCGVQVVRGCSEE